jgi:hypothetical protein
MTDVRLTALNPVDSLVYPVACNTSGELIVADDGIDYLPLTGGQLTGPLTSTSSITVDGSIIAESGNVFIGGTSAGTADIALNANGSATFAAANNEIDATGQLTIKKAAPYTDPSFRILDRNNSNANGVLMYGDGNATFANKVTSGSLRVEQTGGVPSTYFSIAIVNTSDVETTILKADGSATFAGNVTAPNITSLMNMVAELTNRIAILEGN